MERPHFRNLAVHPSFQTIFASGHDNGFTVFELVEQRQQQRRQINERKVRQQQVAASIGNNELDVEYGDWTRNESDDDVDNHITKPLIGGYPTCNFSIDGRRDDNHLPSLTSSRFSSSSSSSSSSSPFHGLPNRTTIMMVLLFLMFFFGSLFLLIFFS